MVKSEKVLEKMKNNPKGWSFDDVKAACERKGCTVKNRNTGSHYAITHPLVEYTVILPKHKPIKPLYIRKLLEFFKRIDEEINNV